MPKWLARAILLNLTFLTLFVFSDYLAWTTLGQDFADIYLSPEKLKILTSRADYLFILRVFRQEGTPEFLLTRSISKQSITVNAPLLMFIAAIALNLLLIRGMSKEGTAPPQKTQPLHVPPMRGDIESTARTRSLLSSIRTVTEKLRNLESEKNNLFSETEKLKQQAEPRIRALEDEVNALRQDIQSMKTLLATEKTETEPPSKPDKTEAEEPKTDTVKRKR